MGDVAGDTMAEFGSGAGSRFGVVSREERLRRFKVECPDSLEWAGGAWSPGGEFVKKLALKNVDTVIQKFKYRLPHTKFFSMEFPEVIRLSGGTHVTLDVVFRPIRYEAYNDAIEIVTERGSFQIPVRAHIAELAATVPRDLAFGLQPTHEVHSKDLRVANVGQIPASFSWSVQGPFKATPARGSLAPGGATTIRIDFAPRSAQVWECNAVCRVEGTGEHGGGRLALPCRITGTGKFAHLTFAEAVVDAGAVVPSPMLQTAARALPSATAGAGDESSAQAMAEMELHRRGIGRFERVVHLSNRSFVAASFTMRHAEHDRAARFAVHPRKGVVPAGGSTPIRVRFEPSTAGDATWDSFTFTTPGGATAQLRAHGEAATPGITLSRKEDVKATAAASGSNATQGREARLVANVSCIPRIALSGGGARTTSVNFGDVTVGSMRRRVVVLTNPSASPVDFHVLVESSAVFRADPGRGTAVPGLDTAVGVTFEPSVPGNYYRRVYVLVANQPPLFVDLLGTAYTDSERPMPLKQRHVDRYQARARLGLGYLSPEAVEERLESSPAFGRALADAEAGVADMDVRDPRPTRSGEATRGQTALAASLFRELRRTESAPRDPSCPLYLSDAELHFGSVSPGRNAARTVHVTNCAGAKVTCRWAPPREGPPGEDQCPFRVSPPHRDLAPGETAAFRVTLAPTRGNLYYTQQLECYVAFKTHRNFRLVDSRSMTPPWCLLVAAAGHSFGPGAEQYLPGIAHDAPGGRVEFPACHVGDAVYRTLQLLNTGSTPAVFRFEDDPAGVFAAAPASGALQPGEFHLVTLRFQPAAPGRHKHPLRCVLNHEPASALTFNVEGGGEVPEVALERGSTLFCPPTCVGVSSRRTVTLTNTTRIPVRFAVAVPDHARNIVRVEPDSGRLRGNERATITCHFTPRARRRYRFNLAVTATSDVGWRARRGGDGGSSGSRVAAAGAASVVGRSNATALARFSAWEDWDEFVIAERGHGDSSSGDGDGGMGGGDGRESRADATPSRLSVPDAVSVPDVRSPRSEGSRSPASKGDTRLEDLLSPSPGGGGGRQGAVPPLSPSALTQDPWGDPLPQGAVTTRRTCTLIGEGSTAALVFDPPSVDVGGVRIGGKTTRRVTLINTSECELEYALDCTVLRAKRVDDDSGGGDDDDGSNDDYSALGLSLPEGGGVIRARARVECPLTFAPTVAGSFEFRVVWRLATVGGSRSDTAAQLSASQGDAVPGMTCRITARGGYPCVAADDVRSAQYSPAWLWDAFSLTALNTELRSPLNAFDREYAATSGLAQDSSLLRTFAFDFPPAPQGSPAEIVYLRVRNTGLVPAALRLKLPTDLEVEVEHWADAGEPGEAELKLADIMARKLFSVCPREARLKPGQAVTVRLSYRFRSLAHGGRHEVPLVLQVGHGKQVRVLLRGMTLPRGAPLLLPSASRLRLHPVPLGLRDPLVQTTELHNAGDAEVVYRLDDRPLQAMQAREWGVAVLTCDNPVGIVPPRGRHLLRWTVHPLEDREYAADLVIHFATRESGASAEELLGLAESMLDGGEQQRLQGEKEEEEEGADPRSSVVRVSSRRGLRLLAGDGGSGGGGGYGYGDVRVEEEEDVEEEEQGGGVAVAPMSSMRSATGSNRAPSKPQKRTVGFSAAAEEGEGVSGAVTGTGSGWITHGMGARVRLLDGGCPAAMGDVRFRLVARGYHTKHWTRRELVRDVAAAECRGQGPRVPTGGGDDAPFTRLPRALAEGEEGELTVAEEGEYSLASVAAEAADKAEGEDEDVPELARGPPRQPRARPFLPDAGVLGKHLSPDQRAQMLARRGHLAQLLLLPQEECDFGDAPRGARVHRIIVVRSVAAPGVGAVHFQWDGGHPLLASGLVTVQPTSGEIEEGGHALCRVTLHAGRGEPQVLCDEIALAAQSVRDRNEETRRQQPAPRAKSRSLLSTSTSRPNGGTRSVASRSLTASHARAERAMHSTVLHEEEDEEEDKEDEEGGEEKGVGGGGRKARRRGMDATKTGPQHHQSVIMRTTQAQEARLKALAHSRRQRASRAGEDRGRSRRSALDQQQQQQQAGDEEEEEPDELAALLGSDELEGREDANGVPLGNGPRPPELSFLRIRGLLVDAVSWHAAHGEAAVRRKFLPASEDGSGDRRLDATQLPEVARASAAEGAQAAQPGGTGVQAAAALRASREEKDGEGGAAAAAATSDAALMGDIVTSLLRDVVSDDAVRRAFETELVDEVVPLFKQLPARPQTPAVQRGLRTLVPQPSRGPSHILHNPGLVPVAGAAAAVGEEESEDDAARRRAARAAALRDPDLQDLLARVLENTLYNISQEALCGEFDLQHAPPQAVRLRHDSA